ncbi:MAG TPA: winged helix-turn-helix domain-containing protein, partial [Gemmataceae bacterium]|nr:winged helix-turn-helix domain-containing protein [Gemmataceae bacterium]
DAADALARFVTHLRRRCMMATKKKTTTKPAPKKAARAAKPDQSSAPARPEADGQAKPKKRTAADKTAQPKKLSALDAAAQVLSEAGEPMNCQEMIAAMTAKGYWTSPAGKTPQATLYSALLREIKTKGDQARFQKTDRGKFARTQVS